jgi:hypothetical protein
MSTIIGYWSNDRRPHLREELQSLLKNVTSGLSSGQLRILRDRGSSAGTCGQDATPSISSHESLQTAIFGLAVHGRHATLQATTDNCGSHESLTATVAAAGNQFAADVSAKASPDELTLKRNIFGRA